MARVKVSDVLETLGFRDNGTSGHRTRAVFHYEPLLRLYNLEIPSLFGRLLPDDGVFLDRTDPSLFQPELSKLLAEYGPLIWPLPGQGPRDHLLKPTENGLYSSDLVYPRDEDILIERLRNWILVKKASPDIDVEALIEKRHKDAKRRIFNTEEPDRLATGRKRARETGKKRITKQRKGAIQRVPVTDSSSENSDAPLFRSIKPPRQSKLKRSGQPFRVAIRIYRPVNSTTGSCQSYGIVFLDNNSDTLAECFARVREHSSMDCAYIEFHPPEDMLLEGKVRIERDSKDAEEAFERVMTMFREAHKFPGEPSYRTVEAEIGTTLTSETERKP